MRNLLFSLICLSSCAAALAGEVQSNGQSAIESVPLPNFAITESLENWVLDSSNKSAKAEFLSDGGYQGQPTVRIVKTEPDGWISFKTGAKIQSVGAGKVMFFSAWVRVEKGGVSLSVINSKDGRSVSLGNGRAMAIESKQWVKLIARVDCSDDQQDFFPSFSAGYAGSGPTEIYLTAPTLEVGAPTPRNSRPQVDGYFAQRAAEKLDRAFLAIPNVKDENNVQATGVGFYLSWRLLKQDDPALGFNLYRKPADADKPAETNKSAVCDNSSDWTKINDKPIVQTTDFVDQSADLAKSWSWKLVPVDSQTGLEQTAESVVARVADFQSGIKIKFRNPETQPSRLAIADLDGDGRYDYVIMYPVGNVDPYYMPGYWKKSQDTLKLEAYNADGKFLWNYDFGWSIEAGVWYSPFIAADLDGDGKAEIAVKTSEGDFRNESGRVDSGPEYLTVFNGETGKPLSKVDWPTRDGFLYNFASRNMLTVAHLDGKTPFLIALRGTYSLQKLVAYQFRNGQLEEKLTWTNAFEPRTVWGKGAHTLHSVDVDRDGRDEIAVGSFLLDDNGTIRWAQGLAHPDHMYIGDIIPSRPGLEVYNGIEGRVDKNGMSVVDADSGEVIWGFQERTYHIHGQGLCADIDPNEPGCECFGGESKNDVTEDRFLWSAEGKLLQRTAPAARLKEKNPDLNIEKDIPMTNIARWGLSMKALYWDADNLKEFWQSNRFLYKYSGDSSLDPRVTGSLLKVADIYGDWREEIITTVPGEMRIYSTRIPAQTRRPCLMQDRNYRASILESSMGYGQSPLLGLEE